MRRIGFVLCAAVFSLGLMAAYAAAGPYSVPVTEKLRFVEAGGLKSSASDTMYVTGKTDTCRTLPFDLSKLDWDTVLQTSQLTTAGYPIARITFVATKANNGASDTLTYNLEHEVGGLVGVGSANCPSCVTAADTMFTYNPILATSTNSALGSVAVAYGGASPLNSVFTGELYFDPHANGANLVFPFERKLRLVIAGDVSGTTPKLSGVMGFITYYAKSSGSTSGTQPTGQ